MTIQFNPKTRSRGIEWCLRTENPVGGCTHDCKWEMPDGEIAKCYAKELAENGLARAGYPYGFETHYWRGEKGLAAMLQGSEPDLIFIDSMSDLFAKDVPAEHTTAVLRNMKGAPHHTYQSLTKAHGRLRLFIDDMPFNQWVGVSSAPDFFKGERWTLKQQEAYTRAALKVLAEVKERTGNIVWMSLEPLSWDMAHLFEDHPLDWVVIGAATNGRKKFQPNPEHVAKLLDIFDRTGTAVFFKGNIRQSFEDNPWLGRWREDFPVTYRDGRLIPAVARREEQAIERGWPLNTMFDRLPRLEQSLVPALVKQPALF